MQINYTHVPINLGTCHRIPQLSRLSLSIYLTSNHQDRLWLSAGTTYAFNKDASVDVGVSYMHGQHVEIKEGPYTFRSEGTAWLYGANFNYRF